MNRLSSLHFIYQGNPLGVRPCLIGPLPFPRFPRLAGPWPARPSLPRIPRRAPAARRRRGRGRTRGPGAEAILGVGTRNPAQGRVSSIPRSFEPPKVAVLVETAGGLQPLKGKSRDPCRFTGNVWNDLGAALFGSAWFGLSCVVVVVSREDVWLDTISTHCSKRIQPATSKTLNWCPKAQLAQDRR